MVEIIHTPKLSLTASLHYVIGETLRTIANRLNLPPIPVIVCTDSYSLYDCIVKLGTTTEKGLMIDLQALRAAVI